MGKTIVVLALSLIIVGIVFSVVGFLPPIKTPTINQPPLYPPSPLPRLASLSLDPSVVDIEVGEGFEVEVVLNTTGQSIDAVDAVLLFDPRFLQATKIQKGEIFAAYPLAATESGRVLLSAVATPQENLLAGFTGQGRLGRVEFVALSPTEETIIAVAPKSVVAAQGEDVLGETKGAVVKIRP